MAWFLVDMRGLNDGQRQFASDWLLESNNYLTIREVHNDSTSKDSGSIGEMD